MAVLVVASTRRLRTHKPRYPTNAPMMTAKTTDLAKSNATCHSDTVMAAAAIAERRNTTADASLSMDSPSSTVTTRGDTPMRLMMLVATGSVGLTIAPSAMPIGNEMSGMAHEKKKPISTALEMTSSTDMPLMTRKSRLNSKVGTETAAEYSSGGSTPARMNSGLISRCGTPGIKLTATPAATRINGAATPTRGAIEFAATMPTTANTATMAYSMVAFPDANWPCSHAGDIDLTMRSNPETTIMLVPSTLVYVPLRTLT